MKKVFTTFIIFVLISTAFGLQNSQKTVINTEKEILGHNSNSKSIFITTKNKFYATSYDNQWTINPDSPLSKSIDSNTRSVVIGTRAGDNTVRLINISSRKTISKLQISNYVDNTGLYESKNKSFISGSSLSSLAIKNVKSGESFSKYSGGYSRSVPNQGKDIDNDGEKEIAIGGSSRYNKAKLEVRELDGELDYRSSIEGDIVGGKFYKDRLIEYNTNKISLRSFNGTILWSKSINDFSRPIIVRDYIVYSDDGELVFLNGDGDRERSFSTGTLENLVYLEDHGGVAGTENGRTVFADLESGEVYEEDISGVEGLDRTDFDEDGESELVVVKSRTVDILDIGRERKDVDQKSIIYGTEPEPILKAVSLNMTVFVGKETAVPERYGNYTRASKADFSNLTQNKEKYYIDSREKAVYVAPIAAENNAVLTFDKQDADRDFSNYSVEELQDKLIQEFEPHHVTVGDLDSNSGLLASYMAVKQGSVPIDNYNAVILRDRLEETFDSIGENRKTVFQGKYISLLEAPAIQKSDPVEEGFFGDPEDGSTYRTDLEYGDLDSDNFLEAGVGRYPGNLSLAFRVFHRSTDREIGDRATVASEYLHASWPVILSTGGGGLRYGSRMERVFEQENYDTTHLVEYRADPVKFLLSLTPVEISSFLGEVENIGEIVERFISESAANAVENSLIIIKALNYTQQLMEMYFEFEWSTYEFNLERGLDRMEELDLDPTSDKKGSVQKSIMKLLYAFVWPERHPNLNETSLQNSIGNSDIIYYQGIGDGEKWVLPDNGTGYSGENSFTPEDVPETERSIVWDSSNLAGTENSRMTEIFFEKGASSYLGYSSVNYPAYSSLTGYNFFRHRKTLGNSLKAAINQLETTDLIYSPTTIYKTGIREKMTNSLRLYGNPEMPKDPVNSQNFETDRSCEENICTMRISLETPQRVVKHGNRKTVKSNATNYLLEPGAVITPLYSFSYRLPEGTEVLRNRERIRTEKHENLSFETYTPITSGGRAFNVSERNITLQKSGLSIQDGRITYVVTGHTGNTTVETAELNLTYRTPVNLAIETENNSLISRVHSEKSFEGELLYRIEDETGDKDIEINEGKNKVELRNLSYGEHQVEVVLTDGSEVVARRERYVKVGQPVEVTGFSPDIRRGSTRTVTVIVSNPNSFPVKKTMRLSTSPELEPGMLESVTRDIELGPNQYRELHWRVLGVETGDASFSVNGERISTEVKSSTKTVRSASPTRIFERLSSPTSEIDVRISDQELEAEWSTEQGSLKIIRNSSSSRSVLETPDFSASRTVSPLREKFRVETEKGSYVNTGERSWRSGSIEKPERKNGLLENETRKLEYYLSRLETSGFRRP